jgi:predicted Fe-Mo cluster-binding NifX family protein
MLIAVTSTDGITVNQHFGHADRLLIFEVAGGKVELLRECAVTPYCIWSKTVRDLPAEQFAATVQQMRECADGQPGHGMRPAQLAAFAEALGDCRVVVTAMIGEAPQEELARIGIAVHAVTGPIQQVLPEIIKLY